MRSRLVYIITKVPDTLSWSFKYGKTLKIHPLKALTHRHTQRRQTGISFRQGVGRVLNSESQNLWCPPQEDGTASLTRFTFKTTASMFLYKWNLFIPQFPAQSSQVCTMGLCLISEQTGTAAVHFLVLRDEQNQPLCPGSYLSLFAVMCWNGVWYSAVYLPPCF